VKGLVRGYIYSSKDTRICVWDRTTRHLHRKLVAHDGPVNAIGIQDNRVASVSGDGKMILWDIISGEKIRTFEGHERGLACVVYKVSRVV
jgi:F-box and WD-40 domain protein 1/11